MHTHREGWEEAGWVDMAIAASRCGDTMEIALVNKAESPYLLECDTCLAVYSIAFALCIAVLLPQQHNALVPAESESCERLAGKQPSHLSTG